MKFPFERKGTDQDIAERIARIFEWNTQVPIAVKASVREGYVILTGEVDWKYQRDTAERLIAGIKGIKLVMNVIDIRKRASAANVKTKIVKALHRHASLESGLVNVSAHPRLAALHHNPCLVAKALPRGGDQITCRCPCRASVRDRGHGPPPPGPSPDDPA